MSYLGKERAGQVAARGNESQFVMQSNLAKDMAQRHDEDFFTGIEKEKTPIEFLESDISNQLEVIHKIISAVEQKLDPVMFPQYEQTISTEKEAIRQVKRSLLYDRLMLLHANLSKISEKLDVIHSRIQL